MSGWRTVRTTFESVKAYGEKSVACAGGCRRRLKRQRVFTQTINPFNKNARGEPKSRHEIQIELRDRLDAWKAEPETCMHCAEASP